MERRSLSRRLLWVVPSALFCGCVPGPSLWSLTVHEQRHFDLRDPAKLPSVVVRPTEPPLTVSDPEPPASAFQEMTLDQAIHVGLANSRVVRVLAGVTAVSSGQTIYDVAISNTTIDQQKAIFDPSIFAGERYNHSEQPQAVPDPRDPTRVRIGGSAFDTRSPSFGLRKQNVTGGSFDLDVFEDTTRTRRGNALLSPQERGSAALTYTQPLLRGAGIAPNIAPIVIARLNTERSYFQYKDSVQDMVRGVIEAYWAVVSARTVAWARRQQVEQGEFAFDRAEARRRRGFGNAAEVAQTRVALANFRANLIAADANVLQREAALRNILGLPPAEPLRITPTTPPTTDRVEPKWDEILRLAEARRPDIIELKLIIEADEQTLLVARNQALPQVDFESQYRWNGLEGTTPRGTRVSSGPGQFTDWSFGVNFSVPLGLRQARANMRRSELVLYRDRANLQQGIHSAAHTLAGNVRNLSQYYEQYQAFKETRAAARINLEQQFAEFRSGLAIFLNVLQAISDWGNAVSSEAQSLALYNSELATLERQTGTILETHGIRFVEERYRSIGPLGRLAERPSYPAALPPTFNGPRYPVSKEPAEADLEKEVPGLRRRDADRPVVPPAEPSSEPLPSPEPDLPPALQPESNLPSLGNPE